MARIRSIHPGQWTSGNFLDCSPLARLLALAIRNTADDHGAFRWKPSTIKAECLPFDNCKIDDLLSELVRNEQIIKYSVDGKDYGLIKDFTQWQRPKKPKYLHPIPPEYRTSTEPVPNQGAPDPELPPQRKEEGGIDGGETRERGKSMISPEAFEVSGDILVAMGLDRDHPLSVGSPMTVQAWLNGGWPREVILVGIQKAMANRRNDPPSTLKYFEKAIARTHAEMSRPLPVAIVQPQEIVHVAQVKSIESVGQTATRLAESGLTFGERPRGIRPEESGDNVRLLSQG